MMRWLRRFRDWWRKYVPNTIHVYCYQCQNGQTKEFVSFWQIDGVVKYWKGHANAELHTIQVLTWCETPILFKSGWLTRNVKDEQYQGVRLY